MLSKAIIGELKTNSALVALIGGAARMFAEVGQGEPTVIVKQNGKAAITGTIREVKLAQIQMLVSGYGIEEGEAIAEATIDAILLLESAEITDGARTFTVKAINHTNGPVLIGFKTVNSLSANLTFGFIETTI